MHLHRFSCRQVSLSLTLILAMGMGVLPTVALAQWTPPVDPGLPSRREGGGTRGNCLQGQYPLTALVPETSFGQTVEDSPTLLWYVPPIATEVAEFVLLDENDNEVYKTTFSIPETGGIVSLRLPTHPQTASAETPIATSHLEANQYYHWYFSLICDPNDRSGDIFTEGWIQRVEPTASLVDQSNTPSGRSRALKQAGIWYDAIAAAVELQRAEPNNQTYQNEWFDLLETVGLGHLVEAEIIDCCEPESSNDQSLHDQSLN